MAIIKRPQITNVGEDVQKSESLYTVGGNECKLVQPLYKTAWSFLKNKNKNKKNKKQKQTTKNRITL